MIPAEEKRTGGYADVNPDVAFWRCTKDSPMTIDGKKAVELKMLIFHDDLEELGESDTGRYVEYGCPNCKYSFWADLGD